MGRGFEAYFSSYIEGTTFTVEEAENIAFHGQIIKTAVKTLTTFWEPSTPR